MPPSWPLPIGYGYADVWPPFTGPQARSQGGGGTTPPPQLPIPKDFVPPFSNFAPPCSNFVPPLEYVDDITRAMSKGGGVLVNVQEGGVFQFFGGRMTSRGQCPRGGACECPRVGAFFKLMTSHGQCPRGGAPGVPPIQVQTPPTWLADYGPGAVFIFCTKNRSKRLRIIILIAGNINK